MELVRYHFDHSEGRAILGYQCLQSEYHYDANFYPVDTAVQILVYSVKKPIAVEELP